MDYREYLSEIGKRGGQSKSEKKQTASRKNALKYKTEAERKEARRKQQRESRLKAKEAKENVLLHKTNGER